MGLQSYRFGLKGSGPLDWGSRGLGNVELHRCNLADKNMFRCILEVIEAWILPIGGLRTLGPV